MLKPKFDAKLKEDKLILKQITRLADSHCHLDLIGKDGIAEALRHNVAFMLTNGTTMESNDKNLSFLDNVHVFVNMGIDPQNAINLNDAHLGALISNIKINAARITGIGEIGLDNTYGEESMNRQRVVFDTLVDLSIKMQKPISVHARGTLDEVIDILHNKGHSRVHLHFFEGDIMQAKKAERLGYMVSIPPLDSARRRRVIKEIAIDNILVESDSPAASKSPQEVISALMMISEVKGISLDRASDIIFDNTRKFFSLSQKNIMMR